MTKISGSCLSQLNDDMLTSRFGISPYEQKNIKLLTKFKIFEWIQNYWINIKFLMNVEVSNKKYKLLNKYEIIK